MDYIIDVIVLAMDLIIINLLIQKVRYQVKVKVVVFGRKLIFFKRVIHKTRLLIYLGLSLIMVFFFFGKIFRVVRRIFVSKRIFV